MKWQLQEEGDTLTVSLRVIRLHLLMGIHVVFIPQGEPGRNATI